MKDKEKEQIRRQTAEEIFKEQLRIAQSCADVKDGDTIIMSTKYFSEMLLRPAFGDDSEKYDYFYDAVDKMKKYIGGLK